MANNQQTSNYFTGDSQNGTEYQGINPSNYYGGAYDVTCTRQGCVPNLLGAGNFDLPAISEIAQYGVNQIYENNQSGGNSPVYGVPNSMYQPITRNNPDTLNETPMSNNQQLNNAVPDTPATTLDYGATFASNQPQQGEGGITDASNPYPVTAESLQYLNGFIRTQIGRRVQIDFLVGSDTIVRKLGYLLGVASNYIIINELDTNDLTTCDFYNIKFITFFY